MADEFALSRLNLPPYLIAEPVTVQILGGVLVQQSVPVAVVGPNCAPVTLGRIEVELRTVITCQAK
jgi:hypothetical protein